MYPATCTVLSTWMQVACVGRVTSTICLSLVCMICPRYLACGVGHVCCLCFHEYFEFEVVLSLFYILLYKSLLVVLESCGMKICMCHYVRCGGRVRGVADVLLDLVTVTS